MPANANSGRSSLSANYTTSFLLVCGFCSGAYSAKLLAGTKHLFSGLSHMRQCGDHVLRMLVAGGPPVRGGGGTPAHQHHLPPGARVADQRLIICQTGRGSDRRSSEELCEAEPKIIRNQPRHAVPQKGKN
jgi:hypothetical protein